MTVEECKSRLDTALLSDDCAGEIERMKESGELEEIVPEFKRAYDMEQNQFHFGTVWDHSLLVVKNISEMTDRLDLRMAALFHDIGKIDCRTVDDKGLVHFYEHEYFSAPLAADILYALEYPSDFVHHVTWLVRNHMCFKQFKNDCTKLKYKHIRKIQYYAKTKSNFNDLMMLIHADNMAHREGYCMPDQIDQIKKMSADIEKEGTDMFGYSLPATIQDIMIYKCCDEITAKRYEGTLLAACYSDPFCTDTKDKCLNRIRNLKF